jgi:hypothetical protein
MINGTTLQLISPPGMRHMMASSQPIDDIKKGG